MSMGERVCCLSTDKKSDEKDVPGLLAPLEFPTLTRTVDASGRRAAPTASMIGNISDNGSMRAPPTASMVGHPPGTSSARETPAASVVGSLPESGKRETPAASLAGPAPVSNPQESSAAASSSNLAHPGLPHPKPAPQTTQQSWYEQDAPREVYEHAKSIMRDIGTRWPSPSSCQPGNVKVFTVTPPRSD